MLNDINQLTLVGTLSEDVKVTQTKSQKPMAILNIATSSEWLDGTEVKKRTLWNKVFFFGEQATRCELYKKGMKVHVTAEVGEKQIYDGEVKTYKTIATGLHVWVMDLGKNNRPLSEPSEENLPL